MKPTGFVPALLLASCGTQHAPDSLVMPASNVSAVQEETVELHEAGPIAIGVFKGAMTGAGLCLMPTMVGANFGRIGVLVGGVVILYCLPFGIVGGAVAGGMVAAAPSQK